VKKAADLLIVGGGLAGGLLALALREKQPDRRVMLIEGGERFGGNHLWSFFDGDVAPGDRWLVEPLICHRWPGHQIRFPGLKRELAAGYQSIESERLDVVLRDRLPPESLLTGTAVTAIDRDQVTLADGRRLTGGAVIDARGMTAGYAKLELGWQKFLGQLLRLRAPHGLTRPCIMDATIDQTDGYRFLYLLPFGPRHLFVEDTYYRADPVIDRDRWAERIGAYAEEQGWLIEAIEREEAAALPIAMGGEFADLWPADDGIGRIGMAAGLFQPMTGYSLPDAVRTAILVAQNSELDAGTLSARLRAHARTEWDSRGYYRLLARLLFHAASPPDRWRMLARFYSLSPGLIARFYAGRSTALDKVRLLAGRPPVPVGRALTVMKEHMA
jgi:lycopene beta-cyclase